MRRGSAPGPLRSNCRLTSSIPVSHRELLSGASGSVSRTMAEKCPILTGTRTSVLFLTLFLK